MSSCYRIHLVQVDPNYQSDNYLLDIELDDSMTPLPGQIFFGVWGKVTDPEYRYPFLLLQDGRIDFGALYELGNLERFHRTNLLSKKLTAGELLSAWERDPDAPALEREYTLRVSKITPLGKRPDPERSSAQ